MKKIFLVVLLISLLVFSGCIKFNINQKIHSNLDSDYQVEVDMAGFASAVKSMSVDNPEAIAEFDKNFSRMCDQITEGDNAQEFKNLKCEVDMQTYVMKMSGTKSLKDDPSLTVEQGLFNTYKFDISKGKDILNSMNTDSVSDMDSTGIFNSEEMDEAMLQQMKAMGFEMTYTIEMPGSITKTDIGEIKGNKVEVNLLSVSGNETFYVESQELNPVYGGAIAIAVLLVLALIIALLKRKKSVH